MMNNGFTWPGGRKAAVSLSFDDARATEIDAGIPILDFFGVKATFYVLPDALPERLDGWRAVAASGHEIGNHTVNHPCSANYPWMGEKGLEYYTLERMEEELVEANTAVERLLDVRPETFAYPCGQSYVGCGEGYRSYVPLVARRFLVGRTVSPFETMHADPRFCDLAAVGALSLDTKKPEQAIALIETAGSRGAWLVFFGHEVSANGGRHSTWPDTLSSVCRYCSDPSNGVWIDTVRAVGSYIARERSGKK